MLGSLASLTDLDLSYNQIGIPGARALLDAWLERGPRPEGFLALTHNRDLEEMIASEILDSCSAPEILAAYQRYREANPEVSVLATTRTLEMGGERGPADIMSALPRDVLVSGDSLRDITIELEERRLGYLHHTVPSFEGMLERPGHDTIFVLMGMHGDGHAAEVEHLADMAEAAWPERMQAATRFIDTLGERDEPVTLADAARWKAIITSAGQFKAFGHPMSNVIGRHGLPVQAFQDSTVARELSDFLVRVPWHVSA